MIPRLIAYLLVSMKLIGLFKNKFVCAKPFLWFRYWFGRAQEWATMPFR